MYVGAAAVTAVSFFLLFAGQASILSAAFVLIALLLLYQRSQRAGILSALAFLVFLGDIRRISALLIGAPLNDPLVLVGPAFVLLITCPMFFRLRLRDAPTKYAFALIVVMILQIANPGPGGGVAGVAGLVFLLPPLLWYWLGRTYGTSFLTRTVFQGIVLVGLLASAVGLYQTFVGVPIWQQAWIDQKFAAHFSLRIGSGIHAFGFSGGPSEYTNLLSMGCFFCVIGVIIGRRVLLLPLAILLPTLFLASSRGIIFRVVFAGAVGYAFKSNNSRLLAIRMVFALAIAFGGLFFGLSQNGDYVAPTRGATAAQADLAHQVNGLAHPLDSKYSDAGSHIEEIARAVVVIFKHPIGFGTGNSNQGVKFSAEGAGVASEFDITDTFLNLGIPGGVVYVLFIGYVMRAGYKYTRTGPKEIAVPIFAMMLAEIGAWFFNGEYGNGPLFFFLIGSVVRAVNQRELSPIAAKSTVANFRRPLRHRLEAESSSQ